MAFSDVLNPQGYEQLNLFGLSYASLYFEPSTVTSNPNILETAHSDVFQSARSYYKVTLQAGEKYSFVIAGNAKDNSTLIANDNLIPVVLNSEINDGSMPGFFDQIDDFVPITSGTYYIKPTWLTSTAYVTVYKYKSADTTAPTVTTFTPADEATGVAVGSNIVITFSEAIARGTGSIVLKTAAGEVIAAHDASSSTNLSVLNNTLTIVQSNPLNYATEYLVEFTSGSIKDLSGNSYAGTTSYNFTTKSSSISHQGGSGDDTLTGGSGNDTIDGGAGVDTSVFSQAIANYQVTKTGSGFIVTGKSGNDGTDTLSNLARPLAATKRCRL
jgi:methionine-rich copper-binding protein CopC